MSRRAGLEDAAARQASAEAAEAQRIQRAEHENVVESVISNSSIHNKADARYQDIGRNVSQS